MKRILHTVLIVILITSDSFSQANFFKFGIGVNAGLTIAQTGFSYDGIKTSKSLSINKSKSFGGSLDYYFTPFIAGGVEYNIVQIKDGPDQYKRQFDFSFTSVEFRANVSAEEFFNLSDHTVLHHLRSVYIGLGLGFINGKNKVLPYDPALDGRILNPANGTNNQKPYSRQDISDIGKSEFSNVLTLPASIGYNYNFYNSYDEVFLQLGLNYKVVYTFSDDIDGYNSNIESNKANDMYTTLGISIKYMLGPRKIYIR